MVSKVSVKTNSFSLLLRKYFKRDLYQIAAWLVGLFALVYFAGSKFNDMYGTKAALEAIKKTLDTPAMISMLGPLDPNAPLTTATVFGAEMMVFMGLFVGMMNIYFAVKSARTDEDSGMMELILARSVSKQTTFGVIVSQLVILNVLNAILLIIAVVGAQIKGATLTGNILFGVSLGAFGLMFGLIALLISQLVNTGRLATMLSYLALGLLYVIRMMTDVANPDYTWFTLYGFIEKLSLYDNNYFLPVLYMLVTCVVFGFAAYAINQKRDVTAGIIQFESHKTKTPFYLVNFPGLMWRLEKNTMIVWLLGMFALGATYGSIFANVGDLVKSNPAIAQLLGTGALKKANTTMIMSFSHKLIIIFAVLGAVAAILVIMKINRDEQKGYLELVHAKSVSRFTIFFSYTITGLVVGAAALIGAVLGMGISGNAVLKDPISLAKLMNGAWGFLPVLIITAAIGSFLVAYLPRLQSLIWLIPIYGVVSLYMGPMLDIPDWATKFTPFGFVNNVPVSNVNWTTFGVMLVLAIILIIVSYLGYHKRDLSVN